MEFSVRIMSNILNFFFYQFLNLKYSNFSSVTFNKKCSRTKLYSENDKNLKYIVPVNILDKAEIVSL